MELTDIGNLLLDLLDRFGVLGALIIFLSILVFKVSDQVIKLLVEKASKGDFTLKKFSRKQRKESIFKINRLLTELLQKTGADRAAVFEYHNGGYNLTGLPFMHFSLAIQRNKLGVDELSKDFDNVLVSSVPDFINELDVNDIYYLEDISPLKDIFPRLYRELSEDNMSSAVFCALEGVDEQIGFLLLSFKEPLSSVKRKVQKELFRKVQKISSYLDFKNMK